jgi:hypothetical protein
LCRIIRHLESEISRNGNEHALPLFELARVLVRFDHVARVIINADHSVMRALKLIVLKKEILTRNAN